MWSFIIALVASSVSAAPLARQANSPCSQLDSQAPFYKPSMVKACLQSVPFSQDVRSNIMSAVEAMNTLNIFEYNQLGKEGRLAQNVDLHAEFQRINTATYSSDYDFQSDLAGVMRSLNDGHYGWTSCYETMFSTKHLLPITAFSSGEATTIHLVPSLPTFVNSHNLNEAYKNIGIDAVALAGAQVLEINGVEVFKYLNEVSGLDYGVYQDPQQRLNALMASYVTREGTFTQTRGAFTMTNYLDKDSITMVVKPKNGAQTTITVPWLTYWNLENPFNYASGADMFNTHCLASSKGMVKRQTPGNANTTVPATPTDLQKLTHTAYTECPINYDAPRYKYQNSPQSSHNYLGGRDIQFYTIPETSVGVMFVSTFSPEDSNGENSQACTYRFIADTYYGLQNFTKAGVTKILIDTNNNGGGLVSLTQLLQRFMTGEKYELDVNFETMFRESPLAKDLLKAHMAIPNEVPGSFSPDSYRAGPQQFADDKDYFQPGLEYRVNDHTMLTSNLIEDSLDYLNRVDRVLGLSNDAPYKPTDIVFTGNGLCGSACASFTNFLIEYYNATAYIASSQPSQPIEFTAFAAAEAFRSSTLYKEAQSINYHNPNLLPELKYKGEFSFSLRGSISPNVAPGQFTQYRTFPAQHTYALSEEMYLNPLANWEYVAKRVFG